MCEEITITLITDGGEEEQGSAGSSCILYLPGRVEPMRVSGLLGRASSIEAEVFAGLMGFALLKLQKFPKSSAEPASALKVSWRTDNMTIVRALDGGLEKWLSNGWRGSSGAPVKQAWLWQLYLLLSADFEVAATHVQRDSGDSDQVACDRAARWAQKRGKQLVAREGEGPVGRLAEIYPERAWRMLDFSELLTELRNLTEGDSNYEKAAQKISKKLGILEL